MKHAYPLCVLLALVWLFVGCKKDDAPKSDLTFDVVDSSVLDISLYSSGYTTTRSVWSKCAQACELNKASIEHIKGTVLRTAEVNLKNPNGRNFDFLDRLTLYAVTSEGNKRIVLAATSVIPRGATTLKLVPTTEDLTAYLQPGTYYIIPYVEVNQPSYVFDLVELQLQYDVRAQQL